MKESAMIITEKLRLIMKKPKEKRITIDNDFLCLHLMQLSYFASILESSQYGLIMYKTLISCLDFKSYEPNEPMFKYKEQYCSMFIVIDGSISVYKPPKELIDNSILIHHKTNKSNFLNQIKKYVAVSVLKEIDRVIGQGEAYGAKDIKKLKKHPCLVEAKSKCIIGLLALTDYSLIFEKTQFLERVTINRLLCSIPFFANLNLNMLNNLVLALKKETFKKGEYVIMQNTTINTIYFVRKGLFQVSLKNTKRFFNDFDMSYFDKLEYNPERFSTYRKFELKDSYNQIIKYKLINYGPGELIGDCEFKIKSEKSLFTIQCDIDNSELLSIDKTQFSQYLIPAFIPIFNDKINEKLAYLKQRLNTIKLCQRKLFLHNNKYIGAILRKLPNDKAQKRHSEMILKAHDQKQSQSHEKKFNKIVALNNEEKTRLKAFVSHKRIQYSANLSVEYSEMNIHDYITTNSTYITKNRSQTAGAKLIQQKKMKYTCTPKMINISLMKDQNKSLHDLLLAKYNDESFCKDNKYNSCMRLKENDIFNIKMKNNKERLKKNEYFNSNSITKKIILRNNSCKIRENLNAIYENFKNDSI